MPSPRGRLIALAAVGIADATRRASGGGSVSAWEAEMRRQLTTAYTAAYIAATAQRLGIPPDSPLISRSRLSRAERADIARAIEGQLPYLRGFAQDIGGMSERAALARAGLYAASITAFYERMRWGDWEIPEQLLPGTAQCMGRCRCTISVTDNGDGTGVLLRVLGGEQHCTECPPLAGEHPVRRRRAA